MSRIAGMVVAALVAVVAGSATAFAQNKIVDGPEVKWKLGAWGKPRAGTANVEILKKFMDERTGGKFRIQIGYESFGQPKELLDLLKVGSLEIDQHLRLATIPRSCRCTRLSTCRSCRSPTPTSRRRSTTPSTRIPLVLKEFAGWNAMPYMSSLLPNNEFVGRGKAPKTVEDFKGMRVRALAGIGDAMRKLGAVPTSVDATEVYTSLERGTVDAAAFPSTYAHQSYRTYEVGKWYTENMMLGSVGCPTLIHVDRWAELPAQYKACSRRRGRSRRPPPRRPIARPTRRTSRCSRRSCSSSSSRPTSSPPSARPAGRRCGRNGSSSARARASRAASC